MLKFELVVFVESILCACAVCDGSVVVGEFADTTTSDAIVVRPKLTDDDAVSNRERFVGTRHELDEDRLRKTISKFVFELEIS